MFTKVIIEIDEVDNLANVNSSEERIMFAAGFVMGSRNSLKRGMFNTGREGHGQLDVKVDSWTEKNKRKDGRKEGMKLKIK